MFHKWHSQKGFKNETDKNDSQKMKQKIDSNPSKVKMFQKIGFIEKVQPNVTSGHS